MNCSSSLLYSYEGSSTLNILLIGVIHHQKDEEANFITI